MARKFIIPLQDASIYEEFTERNTGFDEILEVGKNVDGTKAIRSLIQFDVSSGSAYASSLSSLLAADSASLDSASFYLNLRVANGTNFQRNQSVQFYHVSQSETGEWDEGTGYFAQDFLNPEDGASWIWRTNTPASWSNAGGDTGSLVATCTFDWKPSDIRLDVSDVTRAWITGSENNGLLIKIPSAEETGSNTRIKSNIRFFSRQTHTIFPPTLEAVWDSQVINTFGSGLFITPEEFELFVTNMRSSFVTGSTYRIRFGARPTVPIKSFEDAFRFGNKYFLPSGSYLGVVDASTSTYVVPFDTGSLISADSTGSYFDLKVENMYINRTYKLQVQVDKDWGPEVLDTHHNFKVVLWHK